MGTERGTEATGGPGSASASLPDATVPVPDAAMKISAT